MSKKSNDLVTNLLGKRVRLTTQAEKSAEYAPNPDWIGAILYRETLERGPDAAGGVIAAVREEGGKLFVTVETLSGLLLDPFNLDMLRVVGEVR